MDDRGNIRMIPEGEEPKMNEEQYSVYAIKELINKGQWIPELSDYPFPVYNLVPPTSGMEQRLDGEWVKLNDALKLLAENANMKVALDLQAKSVGELKLYLHNAKQRIRELEAEKVGEHYKVKP